MSSALRPRSPSAFADAAAIGRSEEDSSTSRTCGRPFQKGTRVLPQTGLLCAYSRKASIYHAVWHGFARIVENARVVSKLCLGRHVLKVRLLHAQRADESAFGTDEAGCESTCPWPASAHHDRVGCEVPALLFASAHGLAAPNAVKRKGEGATNRRGDRVERQRGPARENLSRVSALGSHRCRARCSEARPDGPARRDA
jgi:hypothetical protein